jgi:hypothetical protein
MTLLRPPRRRVPAALPSDRGDTHDGSGRATGGRLGAAEFGACVKAPRDGRSDRSLVIGRVGPKALPTGPREPVNPRPRGGGAGRWWVLSRHAVPSHSFAVDLPCSKASAPGRAVALPTVAPPEEPAAARHVLPRFVGTPRLPRGGAPPKAVAEVPTRVQEQGQAVDQPLGNGVKNGDGREVEAVPVEYRHQQRLPAPPSCTQPKHRTEQR